MRTRGAVIGTAAALAGVLAAGGVARAASSSSTPAGGTISVLLQPSGSGGGKILITGAIGDYGTTFDVDQNGKSDPNGAFGATKLTKGTFVVNLTALEAKANGVRPSFNTATCSAAVSVTAKVPIVSGSGTGLYKGLSGTINFTESYGFIAGRYTSGSKNGQCNLSSSGRAIYSLGVAAGVGSVSFG